ncbi:hypothetical protein DFO45_0822 [Azorhizobium sp. AG788]|uniref:hypothetical protein n=1 Tax=Azorhizobium sp. AG788 TaxID=2183897 RepID=UPI00106064FD|nr:hypothetical protein [Azorhizobium sp. AG788]TDT99117.1 hypothetical protein DFO45_0822 [Azorhizobium sp. AG788]
MTVRLIDPRTGAFMDIKVGFSWSLLLFASCLGIPLWLRRLTPWAGLTCGMLLMNWFILSQGGRAPSNTQAYALMSIQVSLAILNGVMAVRGNELTAKGLLERGWVFAHPASPEATVARHRWRIADIALTQEGEIEREIRSAVSQQFRG